MAIVRLASTTPNANTDTLLHFATRQTLVSVVATNKTASVAYITVWTVPYGSSASAYAYHAFNTPLPAYNSVETFRFAIEDNDAIFIKSSIPNVSFYINGIYETVGNQYTIVSTVQPIASNIGDVWVNTGNNSIAYWTGTSWILTSGGEISGSANIEISDTAPIASTQGYLWYNSSNGKTYLYYDSYWVEIGAATLDPIGNYDGGTPATIFGGVSGLDGGGVV